MLSLIQTLLLILLFSSPLFAFFHLQQETAKEPNKLTHMAVEASHANLFPPQLLTNNREMIKPNNHNQIDGGVMALPESFFFPFYQSNVCDPIPTSINKSDSGLTYHHHVTVPPRKRSRDSITESNVLPLPQKNKLSSLTQQPSSFLDQNLLLHLHNQQSDIDRFIAQHTEKVRMELEEQRVRQSRKLLSVIQDAVEKKLKEKDEEIERMGKLNWVLLERMKSLYAENQVWRELAQTNEATANSLRSNLEQVLAMAHVSDDHRDYNDDAESSCGSNHREEAEAATTSGGGRMCKKCGVRESIVLLLPCRHLCLCTMCGSTIRNCPLCHSGINASVHVNFS